MVVDRLVPPDELLGYPDVGNDDGSWTEWGNLIRAHIETVEAE